MEKQISLSGSKSLNHTQLNDKGAIIMTDKGKMIEAVYKAHLSKRATLVIFYLINRANKDLICFPGIKTIATDCNMSDRTVRRALDDLVKSGFVKKDARYRENGGQSSNLYTLVIENDTKTCGGDKEPYCETANIDFSNFEDNKMEPTIQSEEIINAKGDWLTYDTELDFQKVVAPYGKKRNCLQISESKINEYTSGGECRLEYFERLILPP